MPNIEIGVDFMVKENFIYVGIDLHKETHTAVMIDCYNQKLGEITSITSLLDEGKTPEMILNYILGEFGLEIMDKVPAEFTCNCTKDRVEKALISIGKKELNEMIDEGKSIEVNCHFCNKHYNFSVEELTDIRDRAVR